MKTKTATVVIMLLFLGTVIGLPLKFMNDTTSKYSPRNSDAYVSPYGYYYAEESPSTVGLMPLSCESDDKSDIRTITLTSVHFSSSQSMRAGSDEKYDEPEIQLEEMYVSYDLADAYFVQDESYATTYTFGDKLNGQMVEGGWFEVTSNGEKLYIDADVLMTKDEMLNAFQYVLAQALYSEAGGVSKEEMTLVGEVILNRVRTTYWEFARSRTIEQVLAQSGQYPTTWRKIQNGIVPSEDAMEVAEGLLLGTAELSLTSDSYWQTGFYPTWDVEVILVTDCHWYARLAS